MFNWRRSFGTVAVFFCLYYRGLAQEAAVIRVDAGHVYQTIDNFGASDAWSCQFIGGWPEAKRQQMADWLFSLDTLKDGRPKGIGLSLWRTNIGAGSAGQGAASGIGDEWRRAADMLGRWPAGDTVRSRDGKQRVDGQLWFMRAAWQRGVRQFLGFLNSPPVDLTRNGRAYAAKPGECNIDGSKYNDLAKYILRVIRQVNRATGVTFDYLSPVNEPQWEWSDGGQEGCPYDNAAISGVAQALSGVIQSAGVRTHIIVPESGHLKYLLADGDKPGKGDQADVFFSGSSPYNLGRMYHVSKVVAGHSYFSTSPWSEAVMLRRRLAGHMDSLQVSGLRYWQSEYCILGDNAGEIDGRKRDTGMDAALYLARVIHTDLVDGRAAAWQWWLAVSPYDYKDGLIYVDKRKEDGNFYDSKMLWALGNFSRWIRPGMRRVEARGGDDSLLVSAYKGAESRVVVFVNASYADRAIDTELYGTMYTTSDTENLHRHVMGRNERIILKARSVNTLVIKGS